MKTDKTIDLNLSRINHALVNQNDDALVECFENLNLVEFLSQENIQKARIHRMPMLVIFMCTLAVENNISSVRSQSWLTYYQAIQNKKLPETLTAISNNNILKLVLQALLINAKIDRKYLQKIKGASLQWCDAFELAIDHRSWDIAKQILEILQKQSGEESLWLQLCKIITLRQPSFRNELGMPTAGLDFQLISELFHSCIQAIKKLKHYSIANELTILQANNLEDAGNYTEALKLYKSMLSLKDSISTSILIARTHAKSNNLKASIEELDKIISQQCSNKINAQLPTEEIEKNLGLSQAKEKVFNSKLASVVLSDFANVLNQINLNFFLVSGTLLGYEREGGFLRHDKDIDVGVLGWENQYDLCFALLKSNLFTMDAQFLKGHQSYYIPIKHIQSGMWMDIFIYHTENQKYVTGVDFLFGHRQTFAFTPFKLKPMQFLGVNMFIPEDADLNLQENFGDWRISDPSYISHLESPSTVDKGGLPFMLTARLTALECINKGNYRKLGKLIKVLRSHAHRTCAMNDELLAALEKLACQFPSSSTSSATLEATYALA